MNLKRITDAQNKWWCGVEGARPISHGSWSDGEVKYEGCLYNASELIDALWQIYKEDCEEQGIEPTEEGFEDWDDLTAEAESILYDFYPTEVDEILNPNDFEVQIVDMSSTTDAPFKKKDIVSIKEVKDWLKTTGVVYDETVTTEDSIEIHPYSDDSEVDFYVEIKTTDSEWQPKAAYAMRDYID